MRTVERDLDRAAGDAAAGGAMLDGLRRTRGLLDAVVTVLTRKGLITTQDLDAATKRFRQTQQ